MIYPKVYKPGVAYLAINAFFIAFLLFMAFTQMFPLGTFELYRVNDYRLWFMFTVSVIAISMLFRLVLDSIGYKVTFLPDEIRVTTLLGTKTMRYSDISFYRWDTGGGIPAGRSMHTVSPWRLYLVSREPIKNVLDISLLKGPKERSLKIPLNLKIDKDFEDWVNSLPVELGQSTLPLARFRS